MIIFRKSIGEVGVHLFLLHVLFLFGVLRLRVQFLLTGIGLDFKIVRTTEAQTLHGGLDTWKIGKVTEGIPLGYSRYVCLHEIMPILYNNIITRAHA